MRRLRAYLDDTTNELMTKVTWPTWKELQDSAMIVMIASLIIALIVFTMDWCFNWGTGKLYEMFR
jgi:preprotein translocase subunit SecE